jgi:ribose transport system substrate-binding protein
MDMKRSTSGLIAAGLLVTIFAASPPAGAADGKTYKITLSNNFVGNDWRQQMLRSADVAVKKPPLRVG